MIPKTAKIWRNGELIDWDAAQVHVLCHALHYGTSVFEGMRCYRTPRGPALFRAREHYQRLLNSAHLYRMDEFSYTVADLIEATRELIRANGLSECYVRPIIFRGLGDLHVLPFNCPVEVYIACWPWGKYLGDDSLERGVDVCVSSWVRMAPNTLPPMAKAAANYMNSQLILMEARQNGYTEGIALDTRGYVSEGSGQNIFLVRGERIYTPPLSASILPGITRQTVIELAKQLGLEVIEQDIPREALYLADELFFSGTATEICPIRSVDRVQIGDGRPGPLTRRLQEAFRRVFETCQPADWLTFV